MLISCLLKVGRRRFAVMIALQAPGVCRCLWGFFCALARARLNIPQRAGARWFFFRFWLVVKVLSR
jgi:hypothetical protein